VLFKKPRVGSEMRSLGLKTEDVVICWLARTTAGGGVIRMWSDGGMLISRENRMNPDNILL
jgi:hypothetical protein